MIFGPETLDKQSKLKKMFQKKEDKKQMSALTYTYPGRARPDELKAHKVTAQLHAM
jgi:hypothetical protein